MSNSFTCVKQAKSVTIRFWYGEPPGSIIRPDRTTHICQQLQAAGFQCSGLTDPRWKWQSVQHVQLCHVLQITIGQFGPMISYVHHWFCVLTNDKINYRQDIRWSLITWAILVSGPMPVNGVPGGSLTLPTGGSMNATVEISVVLSTVNYRPWFRLSTAQCPHQPLRPQLC